MLLEIKEKHLSEILDEMNEQLNLNIDQQVGLRVELFRFVNWWKESKA